MSLWQPATATTLNHRAIPVPNPHFPWDESNYLVAEVRRENFIADCLSLSLFLSLCAFPRFRLFSHYPGIVQFRKNVALEIIWGNKLVRRTRTRTQTRRSCRSKSLALLWPVFVGWPNGRKGKEFELTVGQITGKVIAVENYKGEI